MDTPDAKFAIGQLINHRLFGYRGVIIDVDPCFQGSEEWYEEVTRSEPPKDKPWYHVLVHDADYETYVAERNLEADGSEEPVNHPDLGKFFDEFRDGYYVSNRLMS
jgi:heat shock protein HspQ